MTNWISTQKHKNLVKINGKYREKSASGYQFLRILFLANWFQHYFEPKISKKHSFSRIPNQLLLQISHH